MVQADDGAKSLKVFGRQKNWMQCVIWIRVGIDFKFPFCQMVKRKIGANIMIYIVQTYASEYVKSRKHILTQRSELECNTNATAALFLNYTHS